MVIIPFLKGFKDGLEHLKVKNDLIKKFGE